MRVPEEPVCIDLFRQNPVFTFLHLKSPVHVVPPLARVISALAPALLSTTATCVFLTNSCCSCRSRIKNKYNMFIIFDCGLLHRAFTYQMLRIIIKNMYKSWKAYHGKLRHGWSTGTGLDLVEGVSPAEGPSWERRENCKYFYFLRLCEKFCIFRKLIDYGGSRWL